MGALPPAVQGRLRADSGLSQAWLVPLSGAVELDLLLTDGEIAVVQLLRHRIQAIREIEVDERWLFVLHLVQRRRFLKLPAQVGELVIAPFLRRPNSLALD